MNARTLACLTLLLAACSTDPTPFEKDLGAADASGADTGSSADMGGSTEDMRNGGGDDAGTPTSDMSGGADQGAGDDAGMGECTDGETRITACGLNDRGEQAEVCVDGMFELDGDCNDPDVCTNGEAQTIACGRNDRGTLAQSCLMGAWINDGMCDDPDECVDAEARTIACGLNDSGSLEQTCTNGTWTDDGMCIGEDTCAENDSRTISCGLNDRGDLDQTCSNGIWVDLTACSDPDVCVDTSTQDVACGLNGRGTQSQTCTAGSWVDSGICADPDACTDGTTQDIACGLNGNGTQAQECITGEWFDSGVCVDPDECTNGDTQQVACGFDGTQDQDCLNGSWFDVGSCIEHVVSYCQTRPPSVTVVANETTPAIEGVVYVDPKTVGAGAASGVTGELIWGPAGSAPSTWTDTAAAAYDRDEDGLTAGDVANDVWTVTLTPNVVGDFDYAYRFSADGGATWQLCDTNGTTDGNFDSTSVGRLEVAAPNLADACRVQFPQLEEGALTGDPVAFYGRVTEPGVAGTGGASAEIVGELWVGPEGGDPTTDPGDFDIVTSTYNTTALNLATDQDEYEAIWTPAAAGAYSYAWRFSVDGGVNWSFCGLEDAAVFAPFSPETMGWIDVWDTAPDLIDFCHVWDDTLSDDADSANLPTVAMEVFEAGVTDQGGAADGALLEVEAAALALEENPALTTATWESLLFKGRRPGVFNNYEYEGSPYSAANQPVVGAYNVAVRVRKAGGTEWTYCDTDDTTQDFRLEATTRLTVTP